MTRFYIRWGGVLAAGILVALLGIQRYHKEVTAISPEELLAEKPDRTVRVIGRVEAGSVSKEAPENRIEFQLSGEQARVPVRYAGTEPDNLRELKTLVVEGRLDPSTGALQAEKISLVPNYGFVTAAYLVVLIPLGLFLFSMERKVALLYIMIKQEKVYQAEEQL